MILKNESVQRFVKEDKSQSDSLELSTNGLLWPIWGNIYESSTVIRHSGARRAFLH